MSLERVKEFFAQHGMEDRIQEFDVSSATVELADSAMEAMKKSRALAEKIADEGRVAYGITTGFGDFQRVAVSSEMSNQLSTNLILSHCTATGEPYSEEVVRGMLLLRANALCVGVSGVRPVLVTMMAEMLNKGVVPVVPQKGSLGASGDLAPLAHMSLPLLGKGRAYYQGVEMDGGEAMAKAGIQTLDTLVCKEGLGLTNGTCAMTSVGTLALYDTICASQLADLIASRPQVAVRQAKQAIRIGKQIDINSAIAFESEAFGLCFSTEDQKDAMHAFLNKEKITTFKNR